MNTTPACNSINAIAHNVGRCVSGVTHAATTDILHLLPLLICAAFSAVMSGIVWTEWRHRRAHIGARFVVIEAPPEADAHAAEALWRNLVGLLRPRWLRVLFGQPHLVFEITASEAGTRIGMWIPASVPPGLVERAIEAAWPSSRTVVQDEMPQPLPLNSWCTGGELRLAHPEHFPLLTSHANDPLRSLYGALAGITDGNSAAIQILVRPVTRRRTARSHRAASALRTGKSPSLGASILDFITPGPTAKIAVPEDPTRAPDIRMVLEKAAHPSWEMCIRYGVTSHGEDRRAKGRARGHAHAIASAFAVYTGRNGLRRRRIRRPAAVLAGRSFRHGDLVSVPELAAVAHLPTDIVVPGLSRAGAASVAPPAEVPRKGKILGDASNTGFSRPVALAPDDARYHLHILGSTGAGKSTLLTNLVLDDVKAGRGAVVIDPKGDLIVDILDRLPEDVGSRTVILDPAELLAPPSLNVLQADAAERDLVVDNVVGIFRRIFEQFWGPRTDDILRAACLTLLRRDGATLAMVPRLLSEPNFRKPYIHDIDDPAGLGGFWTWYESLGSSAQAQVIGPIMNKLRAFLLRDFVRTVVGSATSSFDMGEVLDGGLCLVRVPKGILGDETSRLLGSFVVAKVWQTVTARARLGQQARVDASLYVDECQNFLTLPRAFDEMLAEARGYHLSLVLAHQHLGQLPRDLRDAVSANARNKLFFTMSPEDAGVLERHVTPTLSAHDLSHLGGYQMAARLIVGGRETSAFTMQTRPARLAVVGHGDAIRDTSRDKFGLTEEQRQEEVAKSEPAVPTPGEGRDLGLDSGLELGLELGLALSSETPDDARTRVPVGMNTAKRVSNGPADSMGGNKDQ